MGRLAALEDLDDFLFILYEFSLEPHVPQLRSVTLQLRSSYGSADAPVTVQLRPFDRPEISWAQNMDLIKVVATVTTVLEILAPVQLTRASLAVSISVEVLSWFEGLEVLTGLDDLEGLGRLAGLEGLGRFGGLGGFGRPGKRGGPEGLEGLGSWESLDSLDGVEGLGGLEHLKDLNGLESQNNVTP